MEGSMSSLLDSGDCDSCWLVLASLVEGKVDVACTGTVGEASEWELRHFPSCVVGLGLGTVDGQTVHETIGLGAVRAI